MSYLRTADHYAQNDDHAIQICRNIVETLDRSKKFELDRAKTEDPYYDPNELYGVVPTDLKQPFDVREVIARIVDGSRFQEFKALYGLTLVCGFARIHGYPVGILGNNGVLFSESSLKGAHFIELCAKRKIPLIFLQNITGFIVGKKYEHGGIARDGAKLVHAVANAQVPKFTVIVGGLTEQAIMPCAGADTIRISCGCGRMEKSVSWAANRLPMYLRRSSAKRSKGVKWSEEAEFKKPILEIRAGGRAYYSTARLWDDGAIDPLDTRKMLALGLSASLNAQIEKTAFGVFRM